MSTLAEGALARTGGHSRASEKTKTETACLSSYEVCKDLAKRRSTCVCLCCVTSVGLTVPLRTWLPDEIIMTSTFKV